VATAKKTAAKKTVVKTASAPAKKAPAKKQTAKAPSKKATGGRTYSPAASAKVEEEMKAMGAGKLRSSSGEKVTNRKQAITIALSEARREGDEIPPDPRAKK